MNFFNVIMNFFNVIMNFFNVIMNFFNVILNEVKDLSHCPSFRPFKDVSLRST